MTLSYINKRGREIILTVESQVVGNIVVDDLIHNKIVNNKDGDYAVKIISECFLAQRLGRIVLIENEIEDFAKSLGKIVIEKMIDSSIIKPENREWAIEIATEEIMVRLAIEAV